MSETNTARRTDDAPSPRRPLAPGEPGARIVDEERELLLRVSRVLAEQKGGGPTGAPDYDQALVALRDQVAEAKPEDVPALVEQMMRVSAIAARYGQGRALPVDPESPYFAHMRLREGQRARDVLIGKRGYIDRERGVQIVDWRNAPVSRIYYRYEEGDDYEERVAGRALEGVVEARRNVTIEGGRLLRVSAPQGTFVAGEDGRFHEIDARALVLAGGQGKAARPPAVRRGGRGSRLGEHRGRQLRADKHLPEIAALIDKAQFELISRPDSGLVVLQGGAGTGKTTVALHRIAYLNFADRRRFRPDRILVVVPTVAMARYVERVLPALGVRGVRVRTAAAWFAETLRRVVPGAPRRVNDDAPAAVLRLKKHPMLLDLARELVAEQAAEAEERLAERLAGREGGEALLAAFRREASRPLASRLARFRSFAERNAAAPASTRRIAAGEASRLLARARDVFADFADLLSDTQRLEAGVARHAPGAFGAREIAAVCRRVARQAERPDEEDEGGRAELDGASHDHAPGPEWSLDPPDAGLILYLNTLKWGRIQPPRGDPVRFEHVVVDEGQDLTTAETAVLVTAAGPRRSITLAGDPAQRLVLDNAFEGWERRLARIGVTADANATLTVGYRSTAEVMALAGSLLPSGATSGDAPARPIRAGGPVEVFTFPDRGAAVAMVAEALRSLALREPLASVAVIARYLPQAAAWAAGLERAEVPAVRLVRDQDFSFKPGVEVTDVAQVKGLEFDYVIAVDADAATYPDTVESRHLLHIVATRAAHQLWLVSVGKPSPLLPAPSA